MLRLSHALHESGGVNLGFGSVTGFSKFENLFYLKFK